MRELLKNVILDQKELHWDQENIYRDFSSSALGNSLIVVISGIRRCGKSTLLQQIRKTRTENDYYINFDDDRLIHFKTEHFQLLYELFIELFGEQKTFYFDEIQNITGWERFVRRLHDNGNKIFLTGSNATMLSRELGTHLTGRYIQIELFPFSFREFLSYKKVDTSHEAIHTTKGKAIIKRHFNDYLKNGGLPLYVRFKQTEYLKSMTDSIIYRDVMVRNQLTHEKELMELLYHLATNTTKQTTNNALARSIGIKSPTTIKNYIAYIENTYLLFTLNQFDFSTKKQIYSPKKIYFIDNALVQTLGFLFSENTGRLLENLVFLALRREHEEIFYHQNKKECDFIVKNGLQITRAIQVSYETTSEKTKKREIEGLLEAMQTYDLDSGIILTGNEEEELQIDQKAIQIIPVWKWLLEVNT